MTLGQIKKFLNWVTVTYFLRSWSLWIIFKSSPFWS